MKNLKNKINFLFYFSVIFFIIASFFHFLIIKQEKEAQAAGGMSIGGIATVVIPCPSPSGCQPANCAQNTHQQVAITPYGGDLPMAMPFICTLAGGMLPGLIGPPIGPGVTLLGLFSQLIPIAFPIGAVEKDNAKTLSDKKEKINNSEAYENSYQHKRAYEKTTTIQISPKEFMRISLVTAKQNNDYYIDIYDKLLNSIEFAENL